MATSELSVPELQHGGVDIDPLRVDTSLKSCIDEEPSAATDVEQPWSGTVR